MASNNNKSITPTRPPNLSEEQLTKFLEWQSQETQVRRSEIELRHEELRHNSAHAEKILGAQERDRNAERQFELEKVRTRLMFAGFCILGLIGLILVGLYLGKDALVTDLIKDLGIFLAGAASGYGYSRAKPRREPDENEAD
jgi:hypothetical protein